MRIYKSLEEMIGNTPLLDASRYAESVGACAKIYAKIESRNPAGSVKDRAALQMINDAEASGALTSGSVIIEPTSGKHGNRTCRDRRYARLSRDYRYARHDVA